MRIFNLQFPDESNITPVYGGSLFREVYVDVDFSSGPRAASTEFRFRAVAINYSSVAGDPYGGLIAVLPSADPGYAYNDAGDFVDPTVNGTVPGTVLFLNGFFDPSVRFVFGTQDGSTRSQAFEFTIEVEEPHDSGTYVALDESFATFSAGPSFSDFYGSDVLAAGMSCFWGDLIRCVELCTPEGVISVRSDNFLCDLDSDMIDPIPEDFVIGNDFLIVLDGDYGEAYFNDWDAGLQRYDVSYPGGLTQGEPYPGTMVQGANSWLCTFTHTLS